MRLFVSLLAAFAMTSSLTAKAASAAQSLDQIRYALFKNPQADVEEDLRIHASFGEHQAMRLLGDLLVEKGLAAEREAIELFQRAFADGTGEIDALASLARLVQRAPYHHRRYKAYFQQALTRYPHDRDLASLATTLEVFLAYPDLLPAAHVQHLLQLHQRSCLENCDRALHQATLAQYSGQMAAAEDWYRLAMQTDERAPERYYAFLGEQQNQRFPAVAQELETNIASITPAAAHRIGVVLDRISDQISVEEQLRLEEWRRQSADGLAVPPLPTGEPASTRMRYQALRWIEYASSEDWLPAMATHFHFMTSATEQYNGLQAMMLIERIEQLDPARARPMRIRAMMTAGWNTLNPRGAQDMIATLTQEQYLEGRMLEAEMYGRGILDEPDQQKALSIYQQLAEQGATSALYRQARIYSSGYAICHDYTRAYAYALLALDFGELRAHSLVNELQARLGSKEQEQAQLLRDRMLKELEI